jgi:ABC-type nitrate/sulfonate/bicarbonate transport system permease component
VSLSELGAGMLISGSLAAAIVFLLQRFSTPARVSDPLLQACQLGPIATLPNLQYLFGLTLSSWSVLCVATFTFYRFLGAFTGFNRLSVVPELALATSEALPYGCAAFVFGEMWNATDGVGFMMTVAGALTRLIEV